MAFIAKIDAAETATGKNIRIDERAMYNGKSISSGDRIFIWTSETSGGCGLIAVGNVKSCTIIRGRVIAEVLVEATIRRQLNLSKIAPYRDVDDGSPESELAQLIYRHAHNKVAALSETVREFLEEHFL
ncbi:hypothetical protein [Roseovarius nubinhibens]|uniref:hypothetical protein n=1 Tax=Roseovarius nubinhibens TaxID=314263 RepID=UPI0012EA1B13|nr:hypothetical protein [Roseovarius nubinhibens]